MRLKSPKLLNSLLGILAFLFLLHVLISAAMVLSPAISDTFEKNTLTRYYKDYTAMGPFFTVKKVRSAYYLGYTYKSDQWSEIVYPANENHQLYLTGGSFSRLKRAEFEKYLAGSVYSKEKEGTRQHENFILEYLLDEYLHDQSADSTLVMVFRDSSYQGKIHTDTVRSISYQVNR